MATNYLDTSGLTELLKKLKSKFATKADTSTVTTLQSQVNTNTADITDLGSSMGTMEGDISSLKTDVAKKANSADVYTRDETYSKEQVNAMALGCTVHTEGGRTYATVEDMESGDTTELVAGDRCFITADKSVHIWDGAQWVLALDNNNGYTKEEVDGNFVSTGDIVQTTGQDTDKVMSQKAVTDELAKAGDKGKQWVLVQELEYLPDRLIPTVYTADSEGGTYYADSFPDWCGAVGETFDTTINYIEPWNHKSETLPTCVMNAGSIIKIKRIDDHKFRITQGAPTGVPDPTGFYLTPYEGSVGKTVIPVKSDEDLEYYLEAEGVSDYTSKYTTHFGLHPFGNDYFPYACRFATQGTKLLGYIYHRPLFSTLKIRFTFSYKDNLYHLTTHRIEQDSMYKTNTTWGHIGASIGVGDITDTLWGAFPSNNKQGIFIVFQQGVVYGSKFRLWQLK